MTVSVGVADDQPLIRTGIRTMIEGPPSRDEPPLRVSDERFLTQPVHDR